MDVNGKVAIVTGGLGGIGFATVQYLLRKKAEYVALLDIAKCDSEVSNNKIRELKAEFDKERFDYYMCNVVNIKEFTDCYETVVHKKKHVDILINSAGIYNDHKVDETIDVNFKAVVKSSMLAVERMKEQRKYRGNTGVVLNVASISGLSSKSQAAIYTATKHAVVAWIRAMKEHNEQFGVRIMCICPGLTRTGMATLGDIRLVWPYYANQEVANNFQNRHFQEPENVAAAIIQMLEKGAEGAVWVSQNDEPPFAVKEGEHYEQLRVPID